MAQVQIVDIVAPGRRGLNTEAQNSLLDPAWAVVALNGVVNRTGRMGSRKGWSSKTGTAMSGTPTIDVIHEFLKENGVSEIILTANNTIKSGITDPDASDITSTTTPTADHWQFVNFNDSVIGVQKGHSPIEYTGSGVFTDISFTGTGYDGNCIAAAFGRVWAADADLQTIRYSALLDHTDMSTASGGGTIDMSSVWTGGMDEIVAITAVGSNLVVFGKNHIVLWADRSGSEIGLNPARMEIVDTIEGTGCIARDSVVPIGEGDLFFLSRHGIQSLQRVIAAKSNPVTTLTKHVRQKFEQTVSTDRGTDTELDRVRAIHSPEEGLYIINFPTSDTMYTIDTRHPFQDEDGDVVYPITDWEVGGSIAALANLVTGEIYFGSAGEVGEYTSTQDDGSNFTFNMETGWLDLDRLNHRLKMAKDLVVTVAVGGNVSVSWYWEFDFSGSSLTRTTTYAGIVNSEWGVAEFNVDEYAGGVNLKRKSIPAHGEGQFLKLGMSTSVGAFDIYVQQMSIAMKIGRMIN